MAGGKSRRMGVDKAWLDVGGGRPIIQCVIDVLREVADDVLIVANDERYAALGPRVVPDRWPEGGALGGEDVIALGVPRGPAVARVLAELRDARLDGTVTDRAMEEDLVRHRILEGG